MKSSIYVHFGLLIGLIGAAGGISDTEDRKPVAKKKDIYVYMSEKFHGNHETVRVKSLTNSVLRHYDLEVSKSQIYALGGHLFKLRKKTGIPEIEILGCMAKGELSLPWRDAAARCVGLERAYQSRIL